MEIKILSNSKEDMEVEIEDMTIAEILRTYLNNDSAVTFVAWKREHYTKNPVLALKTKGKTPTKAINDAVSAITKELDKIASDFKKLK